MFILAMTGISPGHADQAHGCMITIDVSRWSPGACAVEEDGNTLTVKWPGGSTISYSARLVMSGEKANASWSTTRGDSTNTEALGQMIRTGDCWSNDKVSICFATDNPVAAAQGGDGLYEDEGSDSADIQPIYPMSDSEQWNRERWIDAHPDDGQGELDRSEKTLVGMIAEIKRLPNDATASAQLDKIEAQLRHEIRGLDEYESVEYELRRKRATIRDAAAASVARQAELDYAQNVESLSLPREYLDATIILEFPFGNDRWFTMRQWLSQLFAKGYRVETVSSYDIEAPGISFKKQDSRAQTLFFEQEGNELYLSYAGEGRNVRPLSSDERQRWWLPLTLTVK